MEGNATRRAKIACAGGHMCSSVVSEVFQYLVLLIEMKQQ